MTSIQPLSPDDAPACDAIVAALPYFFRDPIGIKNASRDLREHTGWITKDGDAVTGFLTLTWSFPEAAEIGWLAVHPEYRRGGRGRLLAEQAALFARKNGARMLFLFASAEEDPPDITDGYAGTRRFYESLGFLKLWVGGQVNWAKDHLLMVRPL